MRFIIIMFLFISCPVLMGQSLKEVSLQNGSMHYYSKGEGEIVLFIHGAQEDYRTFLPQTELLSNELNVVTYSRRFNFPNNNKIIGNYNIKTEAKDLKILIEALGEPVHLVGHSYGGLIAMEFALNNPEWVKSLVLSEPALVQWLTLIPECPITYDKVQEGLINETKKAFKSKDTTLIMKALFEFFVGADIQDQVPSEVLEMLKANLREMEALVHSKDGFKAPFPETLATLEMPIMLLTSEKTMPMLICTNEKLLEILPDATHYHLKNSGHEMWVTHPKELSIYLLDFIKN